MDDALYNEVASLLAEGFQDLHAMRLAEDAVHDPKTKAPLRKALDRLLRDFLSEERLAGLIEEANRDVDRAQGVLRYETRFDSDDWWWVMDRVAALVAADHFLSRMRSGHRPLDLDQIIAELAAIDPKSRNKAFRSELSRSSALLRERVERARLEARCSPALVTSRQPPIARDGAED